MREGARATMLRMVTESVSTRRPLSGADREPSQHLATVCGHRGPLGPAPLIRSVNEPGIGRSSALSGTADRVPLVFLDDADERWCLAVRADHEDVIIGEGPEPIGVVLVAHVTRC